MPTEPNQPLRRFWDEAAPAFDAEPDHGLGDPAVRAAWAERLAGWLPSPPASLLDLGCGTGSLSVVAAELGYTVTGLDFSAVMIALARAKAAQHGRAIAFHVMDAAQPDLPGQRFDVLLCRHLLWTLPAPRAVLQRWLALLQPGGRLVLIEGRWSTGAGLPAAELAGLLPPACTVRAVHALSADARLWGRAVTDERYALLADYTG